MSTAKQKISVFSLVMLNVIAVDSLRSIPFAAKYGFSLVFFYLLAGLFFFIPTALVAAELATGWPERGGIYVWVREAFGLRWGLVTIWLQWVYNIVWFPVILSLLAATLAYVINPLLVSNKVYMVTAILIMFVGTTVVNSFGIRTSSWLTNFASIFGSIIPMLIITVLGFVWSSGGHAVHVTYDWQHFLPHVGALGSLVLLTNVLFSLVGIEMSAIHAKEVANPQKSYPKALLWSAIIILATLIGGSLAIAVVIPGQDIELLSGMLQVFYTFFHTYHVEWMTDVIAACIILGGFGGVAAWVLGPSKGVMVAAEDGAMPKFLAKHNKYYAPIGVLKAQLVIFLCICSVYWLMPTVNSSFWVLSNITAILSLIAYVLMFAAVVALRYRFPQVKRAYTIPGGKFGVWLVALFGISICLITIVIGFLPPDGIDYGPLWTYESILVGGVLFLVILPFIYFWFRKPAKV